MMPVWATLVTLGEWAQAHPALVLTCSGMVLFVLGGTHVMRACRRPWR